MGLRDQRIEATIAVSDLDRARRFYEDQLKLGPADMDQGGVRYPCGDGSHVLVYDSQHAGTSSATVATWFVDDLDAIMAELAGRGVEFEHYDQPGVKTDAQGVVEADGLRAAWFRDPDGNTLALTEIR